VLQPGGEEPFWCARVLPHALAYSPPQRPVRAIMHVSLLVTRIIHSS
jgi:uncharacterized membrane protein